MKHVSVLKQPHGVGSYSRNLRSAKSCTVCPTCHQSAASRVVEWHRYGFVGAVSCLYIHILRNSEMSECKHLVIFVTNSFWASEWYMRRRNEQRLVFKTYLSSCNWCYLNFRISGWIVESFWRCQKNNSTYVGAGSLIKGLRAEN